LSASANYETISFWNSLQTQKRIVGALVMREILTRFGRHNIGFMWLFVEPMLFTLGVLALWTSLGNHSMILPIVAFSVSGYSAIIVLRNTISRCGNAIEPNKALMHHRNVRVVDLFISRIVIEVMGVSVSFLVLSSLLVLLGLMQPPVDLLKVLGAWFMLCWLTLGVSFLFGSLFTLSETADRIWHVASYLFFPLAGPMYMVHWLPQALQPYALMLPTVHCTELLREGLFGNSVTAHYDLMYLVQCNLAFTLLGLMSVRYVANNATVND
jgi:capsular polysaccharide transport system permease protein